jgi:predicted nucleic-acid-binding Zn-ribbon protein
MTRAPSLATVGQSAFRCLVCGGRRFYDRAIKLNTTGAEFLGFAWANQSSIGLWCSNCGYLHEFVGDRVAIWNADSGYPEGTLNIDD